MHSDMWIKDQRGNDHQEVEVVVMQGYSEDDADDADYQMIIKRLKLV